MIMENKNNQSEPTQEPNAERTSYFPADATPRREGGDDSLAEASPTDPRDDEKVLVNTGKDKQAGNTGNKE
jgi:hypothetical protein